MSWWHFRHSERERQSAPDNFDRFFDKSITIESIVSKLASADEVLKFGNLRNAFPRACSVCFDVINVRYSLGIVERSDHIVVSIGARQECIIESDVLELKCLIEERLKCFESMPPPKYADEYDEIEDIKNPVAISSLELVMTSVDFFRDYTPTSLTLDFLRKKFSFPGVGYFHGSVRLHLDGRMKENSQLPWFCWGGGGALEEGVYIIRWLRYAYNGGQQLTGGYTDCILARIPTPLSEAGLERSPYVWGEVLLNDAITMNPDEGYLDTIKSTVGIQGGIVNWIHRIIKKLAAGTASTSPDS